LAHEIACQNGAEIVSALFDQLCMANTTGGPIRVGAICEQNAHAAAFAAALQISNQVLAGTRVSIGTEELGRIEELIEREAFIVSQNRREGRTAAGQAMPDRRKQDMCTFSLFHDPALYLDDEELREAFATANACASVGQAAFQGIKGNLPWAIVSELIVSLQREASNSEGLIEGTYEDFAEFGLRVAVGGVSEVSAHAAAWALAKWVLHEIWTAATEPEGRFSDFNLSTVRDAYPQVVAHFVQLLDFEIAEVTTLLKQEAILVARDRALRMRQLKLEQATRQANRIAPVATEAVQGRAQPHSALNVCPGGFTCEGKEFALSGKPLQVLRAFLYARQHRLTARDLQDSVWGDDSAVGPETVKTAVSAVRSALRTAARKLGLKIAKDPLPCIDRGTKNLAWKLAFPQ